MHILKGAVFAAFGAPFLVAEELVHLDSEPVGKRHRRWQGSAASCEIEREAHSLCVELLERRQLLTYPVSKLGPAVEGVDR